MYGKSGSGKTTLGVTAPKPLIALSERQGMVVVRQAAARLGLPVPAVIHMQSLEDYRGLLRAFHGSRSEPFRVFETVDTTSGPRRQLVFELPVDQWPETVVLDSTTDAMRLVIEEIRTQSPPKAGQDGLPVDSQRFWQVLESRAMALIQGFRDVKAHKLFLCLCDDRMVGEDDNQKRSITPDLPMRKFPEKLSAACNVMAYAYRREKKTLQKVGDRQVTDVRTIYGVMTGGPEHMLLKPHPPLRKFEVPNYSAWVQMIRGELASLPVAPAPSTESAQVEGEEQQPIGNVPAAEPATEEAKPDTAADLAVEDADEGPQFGDGAEKGPEETEEQKPGPRRQSKRASRARGQAVT